MTESDPASALHEMKGIDPPPSVNPHLRLAARREPSVSELMFRLAQGDHQAVSRSITLIESSSPRHQAQAAELVELCQALGRTAKRVGITGVPGVGKSTLIEAWGTRCADRGERLAVLAVDPSSQATHGSILGDKSRMGKLANHPGAFIRPSATRGALGGVAHATREAALVCEAAGFDWIWIETVGVGQSELTVSQMVDTFLLLALPGAGDELQGIKRGVMELADVVAVTKADGSAEIAAQVAKQQIENALHLFSNEGRSRPVRALLTSARAELGLEELDAEIRAFLDEQLQNGGFAERRRNQAVAWLEDGLQRRAWQRVSEADGFAERKEHAAAKVRAGEWTPRRALDHVLPL